MWFPCAKCRKQQGTYFSWKIQWVLPAGINLPFRDFGTLPSCLRTSHICACSGSRIRGAAAFKRPVTYLTNSRELLRFVVRKCPSKHVHGPVKGLTNAHRSSSRWHTRAWGQALIRGVESDVVKRLEAYPAEDVEMELPGTAIPDDEFHEEPQHEEAKVPEEIPNCVRLAVMRIHKNLGRPSKELLCRALRIGGANKVAIRAATGLKCDVCSESKPPKSHLPANLAGTHTEFNQGVGVDRFMLADSGEQVFEFLNIVDLATRFNIGFPVPSKRPDDVLSVLEMVWINWAGPMCHLISDMGGEFEGELVTASEAPWQESGCHKGNKRCRSTRFRGNAKTRLHCELGKECSNQLVWTLACPKGHRSRTQVALVAFGREAERRTGIAGVARSLARVRTTNVMVVGCTTCLRNHGHWSSPETCAIGGCSC